MIDFAKPELPSDDKRWKAIQKEMRKHGYRHDALIQILHSVQGAFGYLGKDALAFVAASLRLPMSKVYAVATFYHYFVLEPAGEHSCVICTGTACYIKGVPELLDMLKREYGVGLGETTADKKLSLVSARCVGACGLAPVAVIDGETYGKLTAESMHETLEKILNSDIAETADASRDEEEVEA